jgi:hypothetical protein
VLALEDHVLFSRQIAHVLAERLAELTEREWHLLFLGGHRPGQAFPEAPRGRSLRTPHEAIRRDAVSYHRTAYDQILVDVPAAPTAMPRWLQTHGALERYCARCFGGVGLTTCPSVPTQPALLPQDCPPFEPLSTTA